MATTKSILLREVSGHLGRQFVIKNYRDITVLSKFPDFSRRKLTPKQIEVNEKMAEANYYALGTIADEKMRNEALLRLNVTRNKLYTSLVREYFRNGK